MRYQRKPEPADGARVQLFLRHEPLPGAIPLVIRADSSLRFDGKTPAELLSAHVWAWHDTSAARPGTELELPPGALTVWTFNGRRLPFGVGGQVALQFGPADRPEKFGLALGAGMGLAIYSYFGYYNVCYLGGEVRDPARTIPRSILVSALAVVVVFALTQLAITGVVPWAEAKKSDNLTAEFMQRVHGPTAATLVTLLLIGSCFASCFSGLLGYSRVPFAAARDGNFFRWFGAVHPRHGQL